jgi:hypothetical protein
VPEDAGAQQLVTLVMGGADEHHGHVMAHALVEKMDRFLIVFAKYERTFLERRVRSTDFEIARLTHNSPTEAGLRPVARVPNHHPAVVVEWTLREWEKISNGIMPDERIDEDLIGDVAELAKPPENSAFESFHVGYGRQNINFDQNAFNNAERLKRIVSQAKPKLPWHAGISKGTVFGELRSVLDAQSEREIVVVPPIGPALIHCTFTEDMRSDVKDNLWQNVKLTGLLHYNANSPHPYLVEVETMTPVIVPEIRPHLADRVGLFRDGVYESPVTGGLRG